MKEKIRKAHIRSNQTSASPHEIEKDLELFSALINLSNDAIFIVDPETAKILYVNDKARENLGYPGEALLRMKIYEFALNVRSLPEWKDMVQRLRPSSVDFFETKQRRKDGSWLPVEVNVRFVRLRDQEFMISVARDITERKQAEMSLLAERNKLEAVMSAIGDGMTVQDRQFRILYQNGPHREKQGAHVGEICYRAYQHREEVCSGCLLVKCFADGRTHRRETSAVTEHGIMHMEVSACPLRDAEGRIIGGVEVVRDITSRKLLEDELVHAQKMEAVGQLAGGMAHDFNNLLTTIIGYGSLMQMTLGSDGPNRQYIDQILASAERAARLTQGLLTFSRKQAMELRTVDLNSIVRGVDKLLRPLVREDIELRIAPSADVLTVIADCGQIEQVLINLTANARDAMKQGGRITIETRMVDVAEGGPSRFGIQQAGRYVVISISDTGAGMDEATQKKIFNPFFTTKEKGRGTGLGLAIVYGIVKQHKGTVHVSSAPGKGSTFTIALPYYGATPDSASTVEAPPPGGTETVLLVEDEAEVRKLLKTVLENAGYRVIEAGNGEEGLARFLESSDTIRIVLTDVIMPKKNGRELYESIRAIRPDMKAVFISGYPDEFLQDRGRLNQGMCYLPKPVSPGVLLRKIRAVLDEGDGDRQP